MTYVQVKHKYQVTQAVSQPPAVQPRSPLLAMIGANKGSNLYKSAQDADNFIRKLRDEWN